MIQGKTVQNNLFWDIVESVAACGLGLYAFFHFRDENLKTWCNLRIMFFLPRTLQQAKPWSIIKTVDHINVSGLFLTWNIFFLLSIAFLVYIVSFALNLKVK